MKKLLILFICLMFTRAAIANPLFLLAGSQSAGGTCSSTPYITQDTHDTGGSIGYSTTAYAVGLQNTSATPLSICSIDLYLRENGSLAGKTLYVERWSITSYDLTSKLQDVMSVDATTLAAVVGYYTLTFPSEITLEQNQALVFTLNEVTGTTNYVTVGYQATASTISDQMYVEYDSTGHGYNGGGVSDFRTKIYRVE